MPEVHHYPGALGRRPGRFAQLRSGSGDRFAGPCARHRADQSPDGGESRGRRGGVEGSARRHAGARLLADLPRVSRACAAADAIVRRVCLEADYDRRVWQFPVILIPLGTAESPDSIVLRPVESVDGMTAQSVLMESGPP